VQPSEAATATAQAQPEHKDWSMTKIGIISAGGAAIVTGTVFAILAASSKSNVSTLIMQHQPVQDVTDAADQGFFRAVLADVFIGTGAIAALIGLFMVD
jgi:hypothetical protein